MEIYYLLFRHFADLWIALSLPQPPTDFCACVCVRFLNWLRAGKAAHPTGNLLTNN